MSGKITLCIDQEWFACNPNLPGVEARIAKGETSLSIYTQYAYTSNTNTKTKMTIAKKYPNVGSAAIYERRGN